MTNRLLLTLVETDFTRRIAEDLKLSQELVKLYRQIAVKNDCPEGPFLRHRGADTPILTSESTLLARNFSRTLGGEVVILSALLGTEKDIFTEQKYSTSPPPGSFTRHTSGGVENFSRSESGVGAAKTWALAKELL